MRRKGKKVRSKRREEKRSQFAGKRVPKSMNLVKGKGIA